MQVLIVSMIAATEPRVVLDGGVEVRGAIAPFEGAEIHAYEGIRYAEPPVGSLRFAPPTEVAYDAGDVIDATAPGSICTQVATAGYGVPFTMANAFVLPYAKYLLGALICIFGLCAGRAAWTFDNGQYSDLEQSVSQAAPTWQSPRVQICSVAALLPALLMLALPGWAWSGSVGEEDCLFLNVYVPAAAAEEPRAVMVWVHGGAYVCGTGRLDDPSYGSSLSMPAAGVVHVTLNYRLGAFGFMYLDGEEQMTPNAGLLDQITAMRWVQQHIHHFGGDPTRIMLYGHSAGGESVLALQRMPGAKGLFHAAAALSPLPRIGATPADAAASWRLALHSTGCQELACLRQLRPSTLATLNVAGDSYPAYGSVPTPDRPNEHTGVKWVVEDGLILTEEWVVDVPLLVSECRETGDFAPPEQTVMSGEVPAWPLTEASFGKWAEAAGLSKEGSTRVWRLYREGVSPISHAEPRPEPDPRKMWSQMGNDLTMFCGLRDTAARQVRSRHAPLYLNLWTYAVPFMYLGMSDAQNAVEGVDIWLTWGEGSAPAEMRAADGWNEEAQRVGAAFRAFLIDFARTKTLGGAWQQYPAVCEYGSELSCSEANVHVQICAVFDDAVGRKFDIELGR